MSEPDEHSPYSPPASMLSEPPLDFGQRGASSMRRFVNLLVDQVAIVLLVFAIVAVHRGPLPFGSGVLVTVGYYALLESVFGLTLGKLFTGTRVVREDGGRAGILKILGRTLARMIPFEPFSVLAGGDPPVGWHDSLSGTRVVRVR